MSGTKVGNVGEVKRIGDSDTRADSVRSSAITAATASTDAAERAATTEAVSEAGGAGAGAGLAATAATAATATSSTSSTSEAAAAAAEAARTPEWESAVGRTGAVYVTKRFKDHRSPEVVSSLHALIAVLASALGPLGTLVYLPPRAARCCVVLTQGYAATRSRVGYAPVPTRPHYQGTYGPTRAMRCPVLTALAYARAMQ
eukprot:1469843-Rhodomonas_salina.2